MTTLELDPSSAQLTLHTGREGAAAKVGHDLVLGVGAWTATVTYEGTTVTGVTATAQTSSLTVLEGHGGLKPLSDKDRAKIASEAAKTLGSAVVTFSGTPAGSALTGTLTIGASSQPWSLPFEVHVAGGQAEVRAQGSIVQTAFGIKPYSAMLGALKLTDEIGVHLQATVVV